MIKVKSIKQWKKLMEKEKDNKILKGVEETYKDLVIENLKQNNKIIQFVEEQFLVYKVFLIVIFSIVIFLLVLWIFG